MKINYFFVKRLIGIVFILSGTFYLTAQTIRVRQPVDTVGFATQSMQMDTLLKRFYRYEGDLIRHAVSNAGMKPGDMWKVILSPHDDYTYVGYLYPALFQNLKAKTIILFGVAHKARQLNLEDKIIFDSNTSWKAPKGKVPVSSIREDIMKKLPEGIFHVNDSMENMEHSLEALIPFIQYYRPDAEIVPILVPYMNFEKADEIARYLAKTIDEVVKTKKWKWGKDFAIVISSDAVHYGDQEWGESNYAFMGNDTAGYRAAVRHEREIMNTLSGQITPGSLRIFNSLTVDPNDYKKYIWTWCGRYSIPVGLLTSYYLSGMLNLKSLTGTPVGYSTSIDHQPVPVKDIGMGTTAPAHIRHWVGYAAMGYR